MLTTKMNPAEAPASMQRIAIVGLGKLGSCVAACLADRGFAVIATDVDAKKVQCVAKGQAPVDEPGLQAAIERAEGRIRSTSEIAELVSNSEAAFFIVPTLSLPDGSFDNSLLSRALRDVADSVRKLKKKEYLFVVNSTVTPGDCDQVLRPMLESVLGKKLGKEFGLCYNPEFIALGDVVQGLLAPDLVLIGESDAAWGARLEQLYRHVCTNRPPIHRMSILNAELTKISVNCAVTMKISFVNQLSEVCAAIAGADPGVILGALGDDRRIGKEYLKPGLGFGGPCFPRDNRLFQYVAKRAGVEAPLAEATDRVNDNVNLRLLQTVLQHTPHDRGVAVFGLAYKPFSNVTEHAPGFWLCRQLGQRNHQVWAHDYMVPASALDGFAGARPIFREEPGELLMSGAATFVITCPWPEYRELFHLPRADRTTPQPVAVIDPWGLLRGRLAASDGISYVTQLVAPVRPAHSD